MGIPVYGTSTTQIIPYGEIPYTRDLTKEEVESAYEANTGKVIVGNFENLDPIAIPGVLVENPYAFLCLGERDAAGAVRHNSVVLEEVAMMAFHCREITHMPAEPAKQYILDKHYHRKTRIRGLLRSKIISASLGGRLWILKMQISI